MALAAGAHRPILSDGKVALFSVLQNASGVTTQVGTATKHPQCSPCFHQTKPWEMRLDNGYPNVHFTPDSEDPAAGTWSLWYGGCVSAVGKQHGCGHQFLFYANSSDGFAWDKA